VGGHLLGNSSIQCVSKIGICYSFYVNWIDYLFDMFHHIYYYLTSSVKPSTLKRGT